MKKLYTFVSCLLMVGATLAQTAKTPINTNAANLPVKPAGTKSIAPATTSSYSNGIQAFEYRPGRAEGDTIFYDAFDDMTNWSHDVLTGNITCGLDVTDGNGPYQGGRVCSTNALPYGAGALTGSDTPGSDMMVGVYGETYPNYVTGSVVTGPIDITGKPDLKLSFYSWYVKWYDGATVEVSTDGTNWITAVDLGDGLSDGGGNVGNGRFDEINVSPLIGAGNTSLYIRVTVDMFDGFGLIIDDMTLTEGASNDLGITYHTNPDSAGYGSFLNNWNTPYYSMIPRKQIDAIVFAPYIYNSASATQDDVTVTVELTDANSNLLYTASSTYDNLAQFDTLVAELGFYPLEFNGVYQIEYTVEGVLGDALPGDNSFYVFYEVSDSTYARDFADYGVTGDAYPSAIYTVNQPAYEIMVNAEFGFDDVIESVSFMPTTMAGPVQIVIYDPNLTELTTEVYSVQAGDLDTWVTVPLSTPYAITGGNDVYVSIRNLGANPGVDIMAHDIVGNTGEWASNWYNNNLMIIDGNTYGSSYSPYIRVNTQEYINPCDDIAVDATIDDLSCAASTDGAIEVDVNFGSTPYTYEWSNGETTNMVSGLGAGIFNVSIADNAGCLKFKSYELAPGAGLGLSTTSTEENCGNMDGTATVSVTGATGLLVYEWETGGFNATETDLAAGTYGVTVSQGVCDFTATATVTAAVSNITISTTVTGVTCDMGNGSAMASADGGATPYSYEWDNGETDSEIYGLDVMTYTVEVTDADGCMSMETITISEDIAGLSGDVSVTDVSSCTTTDGTASVSITSADATSTAFTYLWNNGSTDASVTGLGNGVQIVTITDNNGCMAIEGDFIDANGNNVTITSTSVTDLTCAEAGDGTATVVAAGSSMLTYAWTDEDLNAAGMTPTITGLSANGYFVLVVDPATACQAFAMVQVNEPADLEVSTSAISHVFCLGDADGTITVMATGGPSTDYTYEWSDNAGSTASVGPLAAATYTVTVTSGVCTMTHTETVNAGSSIVANISSGDETCDGDADGQAQVQPSGGSAPYSYAWTGGLTTRVVSNLNDGDYDVTITDNNGCMVTATTAVATPGAITVTVSGNTNVCPGKTTLLTSSVSGGNGGNAYMWSTNSDITANLTAGAGTYSLEVTDANGCTGTSASHTITEFSGGAVVVTTTVTNASTNTANDGAAVAAATGGSGSYTYSWTNSTGVPVSSSATATGLSGSSTGVVYNVAATDGNGCKGTSSITVILSGIEESLAANYTIYPNPNNGTFTIDFVSAENDNYRISVRNVIGQVVADNMVQFGGSYTETIKLNNVEAGIYFVTVKGSKGERTDRVVIK